MVSDAAGDEYNYFFYKKNFWLIHFFVLDVGPQTWLNLPTFNQQEFPAQPTLYTT